MITYFKVKSSIPLGNNTNFCLNAFKLPSIISNSLRLPSLSFLVLIITLFNGFNTINAQNIMAPAKGFTVFVKEDASLVGTETEGTVAAGRDLVLHTGTYQISPPSAANSFYYGGIPIGIAVRRGLVFEGDINNDGDLKINTGHYIKIGSPATPTNSTVTYENGNFRIRPANSTKRTITINTNPGAFTPPVSASSNPVFENIFGTGAGQIDIDGAFNHFYAASAYLGSLANNVTIKDFDNSNFGPLNGPFLDKSLLPAKPKVILNPNGVNVMTISAEAWSSISNELAFENLSGNTGFALIINITQTGSQVTFPLSPQLQNTQGYTLFNLPDANGALSLIGRRGINGVLLAPNAAITTNTQANLEGQFIAKSFEHNGHEIHHIPFIPTLNIPAITVAAVTSCENDAPYLSYTASATFDISGMVGILEWLDPDDNVVHTEAGVPLPSGKRLFPGAAVSPSGAGSAWPGWSFDAGSGKWVFDPSDPNAKLRETGAKIRISITPAAGNPVTYAASVAYPPSTDNCLTSPPGTETSLPVTLAAFTIRDAGCSALLQWQVTEAVNFSHFVVERGTGIQDFQEVARLPYVQNDDRYQYTEGEQKLSNRTYYYRLKMVDNDATFSYSPIRNVALTGCDRTASARIYPNPAVDNVTLSSTSGIQRLDIYTPAGRLVKTQGAASDTEIVINFNNFVPGIYLLRVTTADGSETLRVVKE